MTPETPTPHKLPLDAVLGPLGRGVSQAVWIAGTYPSETKYKLFL
jgi:hypothetical protein